MPVQATCPEGHVLNLDEKFAGKKIRCPRCQSILTVPGGGAKKLSPVKEGPPPRTKRDEEDEDRPRKKKKADDDEEEEDDDRPRKKTKKSRDDDDDEEDDDRPRKKTKKSRDDDDDEDDDDDDEGGDLLVDPEVRRKDRAAQRRWQCKMVHLGLYLHIIRLWTLIGAIVVGIKTAILSRAGMSPEVMMILTAIPAVIAPLLGLAGSFLCCFIPPKSNGRAIIIISFSFDLVAMILWCVASMAEFNWFSMREGPAEKLAFYSSVTSSILTFAGFFLFFSFLQRLGAYVGEPMVGNKALDLIAALIVQIIVAVVGIVLIVLVGPLAAAFLGSLAILLIVLLALGWIIQFYFMFYGGFLRILNQLRDATERKI